MEFSKNNRPRVPGWYWFRSTNEFGGTTEAVAYIGRISDMTNQGNKLWFVKVGSMDEMFYMSWMTTMGEVGFSSESAWDPNCEWAGPIDRPTNSFVRSELKNGNDSAVGLRERSLSSEQDQEGHSGATSAGLRGGDQ